MAWSLYAQLAVTVLVALAGGWLGHSLSARRDFLNERRKLRVTYLLEAYRRLEDAGNRSDPARSWPKFESAIADIQLLGTPEQVHLAREFARGMATRHTALLDPLVYDLRRSLREELHLSPVSESVIYLRFPDNGPPRMEESLNATVRREVDEAKAEAAGIAAPDARRLLEQGAHVSQPTRAIVVAWNGLEALVRQRLGSVGVDTTVLGTAPLLDLALQRGVITGVQHRSLRGLNVMRNLAVHGEREVDSTRAEEFLTLAEAMRVVLEITEPGAGS